MQANLLAFQELAATIFDKIPGSDTGDQLRRKVQEANVELKGGSYYVSYFDVTVGRKVV